MFIGFTDLPYIYLLAPVNLQTKISTLFSVSNVAGYISVVQLAAHRTSESMPER